MSLVEDTPTAGTLATLRHGRVRPTEAGIWPFIRMALPIATTMIMMIVVNRDIMNAN